MARKKDKPEEVKKEENKPNESDNEKRFNRFIEEVKITNDYLKHLATLNIGLIVFTTAFLANPTSSESGGVLLGALICIIISITCLLASQHLLVKEVSESVDDITNIPTKNWKFPYRLSKSIAYISLILGLSFLAVYIAYNIFKIAG